MSASRARRGGGQNLDSLLDTMANVTGILIVLLAVTQISVGNAMTRLRATVAERPELTLESIAMAEAEAATLAAALEPLAARSEALQQDRKEKRTALLSLRVEEGEGGAQRAAMDELAARNRALEAQLRDARAQLGALGQALVESAGAKVTELRIPDPRPAPQGARQTMVFARYGRVFLVDAKPLVESLTRGTYAGTRGKWQWGGGTPNFIDRDQLVAHFESYDVGTPEFRWHIVNNGPRDLFGQAHWRDTSTGESLAELGTADSAFHEALSKLNRRRVQLTFLVWDDSFDVYLRARAISDEAGFASSWDSFGRHQPWRQNLVTSGRLRVE